jgi:putative transposase
MIVFAPKYRRQIIYGKIKEDIGKILRKLCEYKGVMGYLKGKSSLMIFDRHAHLKYRYGNRQFWCKGYYVDTVGRNKKAIEEYIRNQLQEDIASDQISLKEYIDPFTGEPVNKNKKK